MATKKKRQPTKATAKKPDIIEMSLVFVRLLSSNSSMTIVGKNFPSNATVEFSIEGSDPVPSAEHFMVSAKTSASVTLKDESQPETLVEVRCQHETRLLVSHLPSKEELDAMIKSAAQVAWPYAREFIASLVSRMGGRGVLLPLLVIDPKVGPRLLAPLTAVRPSTSDDPSVSTGEGS